MTPLSPNWQKTARYITLRHSTVCWRNYLTHCIAVVHYIRPFAVICSEVFLSSATCIAYLRYLPHVTRYHHVYILLNADKKNQDQESQRHDGSRRASLIHLYTIQSQTAIFLAVLQVSIDISCGTQTRTTACMWCGRPARPQFSFAGTARLLQTGS